VNHRCLRCIKKVLVPKYRLNIATEFIRYATTGL